MKGTVVRWRRTGGRFLPGTGACAGYAVLADHDDRGGGDEPPAVLDSDLLWGAP